MMILALSCLKAQMHCTFCRESTKASLTGSRPKFVFSSVGGKLPPRSRLRRIGIPLTKTSSNF
jgi:hypothetical protein